MSKLKPVDLLPPTMKNSVVVAETVLDAQPLPITRLGSGLRVGQLDPGDSLATCWERVRTCDVIVLVSRPGMKLPPRIVEEIVAIDEKRSSLRFDVIVNQAKQTSLRYFRFDCGNGATGRWRLMTALSLARAARFADGLLQPRRGGNGFSTRVLRRLRRIIDKFSSEAQSSLLAPTPIVSNKLNGYVLTTRFDDMPEFSFPAAIHVALTKNCNLKCVMCPYHSEDLRSQHTTGYFDRAQRLPTPLFEKLIEEAGRHRAHLSFGQYDEPFIYKNFASWAVKAKQAGCSVSITTNGTLLDEKAAEMLLAAGIEQISFSLDAASHESYSRIRLDDFEVPLQNLRTLVEVKKRIGGPTQLRACLVVQEQNKHEQEAFYDLIDGLGLDMVSFYNLTTYTDGVWSSPVLNFGIDEEKPETRSVCSQLYDQMAIYPDGNVALCCLTTMYLGYRDDVPYVGNLKDCSVKELWHSETYRRIRSEAFRGQFSNSVCRDCTIWHNYQGGFTTSTRGHKMYQNAYETIVYLR